MKSYNGRAVFPHTRILDIDYIFCVSCGARNGSCFDTCFICKRELKDYPDDYCSVCGCEQ